MKNLPRTTDGAYEVTEHWSLGVITRPELERMLTIDEGNSGRCISRRVR